MAEPHLIFNMRKAMNRSHLVPKQVLAHRSDGTSYMTTVYIDPSTGQQVSQPAFSLAEFDKLKADKAAAMKYLKDNGITWNESPHEGVNWMRASMAAKKAAGASSGVANATKTSSAGKSSTATSTTQKTQNKTNYDYSAMAAKGYDKTDGKTKAKILKTFCNKEQFMDVAHLLVGHGAISWESHPNEAINLMRASMAFSTWADSHSLDDLSRLTSGKPLDGEVAAIAAAAEAPVVKQKEPKEKKKVDTSIPVPEGADERTKSLIGFVNAIKTKEELDTVKSVGIIAEDEASMTYLKRVLLPKAAEQRENRGNSRSRGTYGSGANEEIFRALDKTLKTTSKRVLMHGVIDAQKATLAPVLFTSPRSLLTLPGDFGSTPSEFSDYTKAGGSYGSENEVVPHRLFDKFQQSFGAYDYEPEKQTENYDYGTWFNRGYNTEDRKENMPISEIEKIFDKDKDGFYRALKIIAEKHPELSKYVETMQSQYIEIMKSCGYQTKLLRALYDNRGTELDISFVNATQRYQTDRVIHDHIKASLSPKEWESFKKKYVSSHYYRDSLKVSENSPTVIEISNPDYNHQDPDTPRNINVTVDFSNLKVDGKPIFDVARDTGRNYTGYTDLFRFTVYSDKELQVFQEEIEREILTSDNRTKVMGLLSDMFKVKIVNDGKDRWEDKTHDVTRPEQGDFDALDAILSNLFRMSEVNDARNRATQALDRKYTKSAANGQGAALENVLDFVATDGLHTVRGNGTFIIYDSYETGRKEYTVDEILAKLDKQAREIPTIGLEQSKKLKTELTTYAKDRSDKIDPKYMGGTKRNYTTGTDEPIYETRYDLIGGSGSGIHVWYNTSDGNQNNVPSSHPLCDLMVENLYDLAVHSPSIRGIRVKTDEDVRKLLLRNLGLLAAKSGGEDAEDIITQELRKQVLSSVKCSLATIPEAEYKDLQHRVKMDWDNRVHGGNSAFFYGAYKINNLAVRQKLEEAAAQIGETPEEYYHGTSFGGTKGILGNTGGFSVNRQVQSSAGASQAGSMLGEGVYLAKKSSKSAQYFGGYNYGRYGRGTLFICDAIMGKKAKYNQDLWRYDSSFDTIEAAEASNSRGSLCNDEWAVRHADWVVPKILIDMENKRRV